ncbi:hypothetical protein [Candidatus Syntrophocurvum alkaliphilum]|nr:hypothetical protein [Candidatus Syntrophocurvum alkaliphilum]
MRSLLRKINKHVQLSSLEYSQLMNYIKDLKENSPESYRVFYFKYSKILNDYYNIYLTEFTCGFDDLINHLLFNPKLVNKITNGSITYDLFPTHMHEYIIKVFGGCINYETIEQLKDIFHPSLTEDIPRPRLEEIVYKYEDSNPYKEQGLKTHFERIGRYSFVTRLQSIRYLTKNKAKNDRVEFIRPDLLGGIFTNKQKSIYYYIFLTEAEESKAKNACRILNRTLYSSTKSKDIF